MQEMELDKEFKCLDCKAEINCKIQEELYKKCLGDPR